MMKICSVCKIEKYFTGFSIDKSRKDGLSYVCKDCSNSRSLKYNTGHRKTNNLNSRRWYLKRVHGLTPDQFEQMRLDQNNICPLCKKEFTEEDYPIVEHCHKTDKIRGLTHNLCNLKLSDMDLDFAQNIVEYLKKVD